MPPRSPDSTAIRLPTSRGDGAVVLDDVAVAAAVSDIDGADLNGGELSVSISQGIDAAEDLLSLDTGGAVSLAGTTAGSDVSVGGTVVGTLVNTIAVGTGLIIDLGVNATFADVGVLLQSITYENTDVTTATLGARVIDVTITDAGHPRRQYPLRPTLLPPRPHRVQMNWTDIGYPRSSTTPRILWWRWTPRPQNRRCHDHPPAPFRPIRSR